MKASAATLALLALIACSPTPLPVYSSPTPNMWLPFQQGLPTQATVLALAVDPGDPRRVLAGTYDPTGAYAANASALVALNANTAAAWQPFDNGLGSVPVFDFYALPDALLAGTTAGLFRLVADTWIRIESIPAVAVYSIARGADGAIYASTDRHGVFVSADEGKSWMHVPGLDNQVVLSAVAVDQRTILAGTSGNGVFISRDGGDHWQSLSPFGGDYVSFIQVDPHDSTVYLRTRGGLYRSRDAGETWVLLGGAADDLVNALLFDPSSTRVYAATSGRGVISSDDGGATWQDRAAGLPPGIPTLALAQLDSQTLLAGTQIGIYLSRDAGQSWSPASQGLGVPQVHALALNSQTGSLFAATETGLYRSDSSGTFVRIGSPAMQAPILSLAIAPDDPQILFAGAFRRGIFVSRDGGSLWSPAGDIFAGRLSPTGLAVDPANASNVFARVLYERVYKSTDGAQTWHSVWTGMPDDAEVETMSIAASDPRLMYAGTNDGLYVSTDAGESWTRRGIDGRTVLAVWIDPQDPNVLLAGSTDGPYRSTDAAAVWTPIALEQIAVSAIAPGANGALYVGTKYDGVWSSADGGRAWTRLSAGLDNASVVALVVDDARNVVYAATSRGIFRAPAAAEHLP